MRNKAKILTLVAAFAMVTSSAVWACHSNVFDEIFTKIQRQITNGDLEKDQIAAIWDLRNEFNRKKGLDHERSLSCSAHDGHVPAFVAAAAGVLDDAQFEAATGQKKTEVQKLRFEVNQLKKELQEIRSLIAELKSSK